MFYFPGGKMERPLKGHISAVVAPLFCFFFMAMLQLIHVAIVDNETTLFWANFVK